MTTYHQYSRELQALDQAKLPWAPEAQGRWSLVGACMTLIDTAFPYVVLSTLLPYLLLQRLYCGFILHQDECHSENLSWAFGCDSQYRAPTWLLAFLMAEALFHVAMRCKLAYLQSKDPLVESLKAGGILTMKQRDEHWKKMMTAVSDDPAKFFQDWFSGTPMEDLTTEDLQNFIAWCSFDGRLVEHLSPQELAQLETFVEDALIRTKQRRGFAFEKRQQQQDALTVDTDDCSSLSSSGEDDDDDDDEDDIGDSASTCELQAAAEEQQWEPTIVVDSDAVPNDKEVAIQQELLWKTLSLHQSKGLPEEQLVEVMRNTTRAHQAAAVPDGHRARRFKRPTADTILGIHIAPLFVHVSVFCITHIIAPIVFWLLGFQTHQAAGSMTYHYRPGNSNNANANPLPLVFIHGIGIGPIAYVCLICQMMATGQAVFLPELPTVSAFRPWVMPGACLSPSQVATGLSLMLAQHGYDKATFSGHSFGTFWMSYLVKYAPSVVAGLVFVDPVCFCLYDSLLTQRTVYNQPDPGDVGYLVRTDMMVSWSIQRNFSWVEGNLFVDDIPDNIPVAVFVSGEDKIAPSKIQQGYLQRHRDCKVQAFDGDASETKKNLWETQDLSVTVFDGYDHGLWLLNPQQTIPPLVEAMDALTKRC